MKLPKVVMKESTDDFQDGLNAIEKLSLETVPVVDKAVPIYTENPDPNACRGTYAELINDRKSRKDAAIKIKNGLAPLERSLSEKFAVLNTSGPGFHQIVAKCAGENQWGAETLVGNAQPGEKFMGYTIPGSAHQGLRIVFSPYEPKTPAACGTKPLATFDKLVGESPNSNSDMKRAHVLLIQYTKNLPKVIEGLGEEIKGFEAGLTRCGSSGAITAAKEGIAKPDSSTVSEAEKKNDPKNPASKNDASSADAAKKSKAAAMGDFEGKLTDSKASVPTVENGPKSTVGSGAAAAALEAQEKETWLADGKKERDGMPGFGDSTGAAKVVADGKTGEISFANKNPEGSNVAPGSTSAMEYTKQRREELAA
ncbi:MAG: hypothetical protein EOP06_25920, partial [Proteobacteria bacterium]